MLKSVVGLTIKSMKSPRKGNRDNVRDNKWEEIRKVKKKKERKVELGHAPIKRWCLFYPWVWKGSVTVFTGTVWYKADCVASKARSSKAVLLQLCLLAKLTWSPKPHVTSHLIAEGLPTVRKPKWGHVERSHRIPWEERELLSCSSPFCPSSSSQLTTRSCEKNTVLSFAEIHGRL